MLLTKMEVLQSARVGCTVVADCKNGDKLQGILKGVSEEYIELLLEKEQNTRLRWEEILVVSISDDFWEEPKEQEAYQWWKKQYNYASNSRFSLGVSYRELFDQIAELSGDPIMASLYKITNSKKLYMIDQKDEKRFQKSLDTYLKRMKVTDNEVSAARALIYLAAKDYSTGLKELVEIISDSEDPKKILPLICYYQDMSDGAGAFYWAGTCYDDQNMIDQNEGLWWNYLLQAVTFDYYDEVTYQLLDLYDSRPRLALESLAFLFFAKTDYYKGTLMYREARKDSPMSKAQFRMYLSSLQYGKMYGEHYSYYARYKKWVSVILDEDYDIYRTYNTDDGLCGFIYDYVPGQGYCKVVGLDLLSYFLHFDDCNVTDANNTKSIRAKLQREVCSMSPVEDELPVCIEFCRSGAVNSKRSYAVLRAELTSIANCM